MNLKRIIVGLAVVAALVLTSIGVISGKINFCVPLSSPGYEDTYVVTWGDYYVLYDFANPSNPIPLLGPTYW